MENMEPHGDESLYNCRMASQLVARPWRGHRLVTAACLSALLPVACSHSAEPETQTAGPVSVATVVARVDTLTDRVTGSGTVVPSLAADWTIYAPGSAEVAELPKKEGDAVAVGDLLVRFDVAAIAQEVSNSELAESQARSRVEAAKTEFVKVTKLSDGGYVARNVLDAAKTELAAAQAALNLATGEVALAQSHEAETSIHAKFAGVVNKVWHAKGDAVIAAETDPVIRVVDPARLQVVAPLPMVDLVRISPGMPASIVPPGGPGEPGTVAMRSTVADPTTRTAELRLSFTGPTTLALGAPVDVDIVIATHPDLLIVPRAAIQHDDDTSFVYVAGADNVAHRKAVQIGIGTRTQVQILSGITAGEKVITSGFDQIADGTPILAER